MSDSTQVRSNQFTRTRFELPVQPLVGVALVRQRMVLRRQSTEPVVVRPAASPDGRLAPAPGSAIQQTVDEALAGGGRTLDAQDQERFSSHFGHDFSQVRIHTSTQAADSAARLNSRAFTVGNDVVFNEGEYAPESAEGEALLAHELAHVAQQALRPGRHKLQNWLPLSSPGDPAETEARAAAAAFRAGQRFQVRVAPQATISRDGPATTTAPSPAAPAARTDASALIAKYPHLSRTLSPDQAAQIQQVFDARARILELSQEAAPYQGSILHEDVVKREAIQEKINTQVDIERRNQSIFIPTEKLLANDILSQSKDDPADVVAFLDALYKELIAYPTRLTILPGMTPDPLFGLNWGPNSWRMNHEGGLIKFNHVMQIEKFNIPYQALLTKGMVRNLQNMADISREAGGQLYNMQGKKVGEIWGYIWNTSIKIGSEAGKLTGYYDDAQGQREMFMDYIKVKGAKIVLRAPDKWLHIYTLDPSFTTIDMRSPDRDGYVYVFNFGSAVSDVVRISTSDGRELEPGASSTGTGWRCREVMTEAEQLAVGAIFGDAFEDPTIISTFGQILIGVIPIVGQIADARDVAVGIYKIWETGGKDGKVQTAMAMIGFVPVLGDGLKSAWKAGGKKAAQEAVQAAAPGARRAMAEAIASSPKAVAETFNVPLRQVYGDLAAQSAKAIAEGGQAAADFARTLTSALDNVGGNAGVLVMQAGGNWSKIAKALPDDDVGRALGRRMQEWRTAQVGKLDSSMKAMAPELAPSLGGRALEPPTLKSTGTNSVVSDIDVSFLGPDATTFRNAAIRHMEDLYGPTWRQVLDIDIFGDPTRLYLFSDLPGQAAKNVEKKLVKESELNVLAKMMKDGAPAADIEKFAKQIGVDVKDVAARQSEIAKLASDPDLYRQTELKMDVLHRQFLAESDPIKKAAIAEEMAITQGKLNAAIEGPYLTPGGVDKHVTRREGVAGSRTGPFKAMSPAMGYMALLDDLYMLQHTLGAANELTASSAKSMTKYAQRLLISAGQLGVDMSKRGDPRALFDSVSDLLARSRVDPSKTLKEAADQLASAKAMLQSQINDMVPAVKKNAEAYLAEAPVVERAAVNQSVEKSQRALLQQAALISRVTIRYENEHREGQ